MGPKMLKSETEFNRRMTSLLLTIGDAINVQNKTRILEGKKSSKVLNRWYDETSEMWKEYGPPAA